MVLINGTDVVDRHNRPSTAQMVLLRAFFVNDGAYQDPVDISGVTILNRNRNLSPSTILNSQVLLDTVNLSSADILMHFGVSSSAGWLNASDYSPGAQASGIYKLGTGQFAVVLDGTRDSSGWCDLDDANFEVANGASSVADYNDVWTVKLLAGSPYKTVIQDFSLKDDTFFTTTQVLLLKPRNELTTKRIVYGSMIDLKVNTEINIENKDIDESVKNIFKDSIIASASMEVTKLNDVPGLSSRFIVSSFANTSSLLDVTSDNTIVLNFDTRNLAPIAAANAETFGSPIGAYEVRVQYTLLNQILKSPPFHVIIQ
jgi:hypothetical protein